MFANSDRLGTDVLPICFCLKSESFLLAGLMMASDGDT